MKEFRKGIYRIRNIISVPPVGFLIDSSPLSSGTGTLDITGGVAGETISLTFLVTPEVGVFNSLVFDAPVTVSGSLDPTHLSRPGTMLLDGSGNGSSVYTFDPLISMSSCLITVTARSSGDPDGVGDTTNII